MSSYYNDLLQLLKQPILLVKPEGSSLQQKAWCRSTENEAAIYIASFFQRDNNQP